MIKLYNFFAVSFPRSAAKPHQIHLQHHLLPCTAYTIIAKHKQIEWANKINIYIYIYIWHKYTNHTITPKEFHPLISHHMATTMLFMFYIFLWVSLGVLLPYLSATTDRAHAGNHATDHTPQRQVEFPNTNRGCNVLRLPNSSLNCWGGQSIYTHLYWPQPAHSHQQHSRTRAQLKDSSCSFAIPSSTRGMPFRAQLEECHVLNPYPELI